MRILITGGSGFIGSHLIPHLLAHKHQIDILTRSPLKTFKKLGHQINVLTELNHLANLDRYDGIINLAGEPIASSRWSSHKKHTICHSRWDITQQLRDLLLASEHPPHVFLSGSAVGVYGDQGEQTLTEETPLKADGFSHLVCSKWEQIAQEAQEKTRVCILRTGLVLGPDGGMLKSLLLPFKWGLGSVIGSGKQYQPWIHIHDMVHALEFLLNHEHCEGIYNLTAPMPVTNQLFTQQLANELNRPAWFRLPEPPLKLLLGEMSELLTGGQRAVPEHLQQAGFQFQYTQLDAALAEILSHTH